MLSSHNTNSISCCTYKHQTSHHISFIGFIVTSHFGMIWRWWWHFSFTLVFALVLNPTVKGFFFTFPLPRRCEWWWHYEWINYRNLKHFIKYFKDDLEWYTKISLKSKFCRRVRCLMMTMYICKRARRRNIFVTIESFRDKCVKWSLISVSKIHSTKLSVILQFIKLCYSLATVARSSETENYVVLLSWWIITARIVNGFALSVAVLLL